MKLYRELASWWPILSPPSDYVEEASFYTQQLLAAGDAPAHTLLELGCGGGNNASHMKSAFAITLIDVSEDMLSVSRRLNPECEHLSGDMRSVRLGREFDGVFVHDAICYMTSLEELRLAVQTAFVHCRPGGAALFAPDYVRERFRPSTDHGGSDGEGRALRYLEWTWDPDPRDTTYVVDYVYVLRDVDGTVRVEHDRHDEGLFSRAQWLEVLSDAGFEPRMVPFDHSDLDPTTYELFLAIKPRT